MKEAVTAVPEAEREQDFQPLAPPERAGLLAVVGAVQRGDERADRRRARPERGDDADQQQPAAAVIHHGGERAGDRGAGFAGNTEASGP